MAAVGDRVQLAPVGEDMRTLAQLNDDGATFEQIADVIEEQWKSL
jgi:hypothetical protein